jgi:hypothetical protein
VYAAADLSFVACQHLVNYVHSPSVSTLLNMYNVLCLLTCPATQLVGVLLLCAAFVLAAVDRPLSLVAQQQTLSMQSSHRDM